MTDKQDHLTEGWPADPGNRALAEFAARVHAARPELSPAALGRIAAQMRREIAAERPARRSRPFRFAAAAAIAAGVVLAVGILFRDALFVPEGDPAPEAQRPTTPITPDPAAGAAEAAKRFAAASSIKEKLAALDYAPNGMPADFFADKLPAEARYLLALSTLKPHLTWHPAHVTPDDRGFERAKQLQEERAGGDSDYRWHPAHAGEPWMTADIPFAAREEMRKAVEPARKDLPQQLKAAPEHQPEDLFWRVRDPGHADVARAVALLKGVRGGDWETRARHWLAEIERNNTVLTFDVAGGYASGRPAAVVMDVRNADSVTLKLYRVREPGPLAAVADRIGNDFIFHDHGLRGGETQLIERLHALRALRDRVRRTEETRALRPAPVMREADLVHQAVVRPADLRGVPDGGRGRWEERDWDEDDGDAESEYFGDACTRFADRLDRTYRREPGELSSWWCGRMITLPAAAVREPGAYVLAAEANGQVAYAPVVVDPLSLTLRRCRDGVFAIVSSADGRAPAPGAQVLGGDMAEPAVADAQGVAFAKLFAAGDRAIVAHQAGRFAIGGFGRVFDGVYKSPWDREQFVFNRVRRLVEARKIEQAAHVYSDQHVVAAYTDRPAYRPGQTVQFKLIVRKLLPTAKPAAKPAAGGTAFRAEDFDLTSRLDLPAEGAPVRYAVLDPKGRTVAAGELTLNDYGTAAGSAELNAEAMSGPHSLRVNVAGEDRIVPDVFAVKHYRRPNFEVTIKAPKAVKTGEKFALEVGARYYFGAPVTHGEVQTEILWPGPRGRQPEIVIDGLDDTARKHYSWTAAPDAPAGVCRIVCTVKDESGRVASAAHELQIVGGPPARTPPAESPPALAALPRFMPVGKPFTVAAADKVWAEHEHFDPLLAKPAAGKAELTLREPGWYHIRCGDDSTDVFAYGGVAHPLAEPGPERFQRGGNDHGGGWLDLTDYEAEQDCTYPGRDPESARLLAMIDNRLAEVGGKLRLLVYTPATPARLLFTMEGRTVVDYFVAKTPESESCYHIVEIPITRRHLPNVYIQGRILTGGAADARAALEQELQKAVEQIADGGDGTEDPRWCRIDVTDPHAAPGDEALTVTVETDRPAYRPGETVGVRMRVADRQGRPRAAELSLGAVDESVYSFGADRTAGLAGQFADPHEPRRYQRKTWRSGRGDRWAADKETLVALARAQESLKALQEAARAVDATVAVVRGLAVLEGAPTRLPSPSTFGGQMPTGALPAARLRMDFRETAAWLPQLRAGADGVVSTSFKLPDSLTRYRLTAVGLTRETEIGTGRSGFTVGIPLAAQVMLPRFAVEGDRLQVIGLVHNTTARAMTVRAEWRVEGAAAEGATARNLDVAAGSSGKVALWLTTDRIGEARVSLSVRGAGEADAEVHTLPVHPLGRPREVALNAALPALVRAGAAGGVGEFVRSTEVRLPAGFVARDLRLTLSCVDVAQGMEGLAYLVDYPYGCVEQTMSRFLPAVMVSHAAKQTPVDLPPEVAAKLPDVLGKGLARLYNFQHADGGWGWWEHDATNEPMTVYVVYGLARCRAAGTAVDADVLKRGCDHLLGELRAGRLAPELPARAWLALALAGAADAGLEAAAAAALKAPPPPAARCNLALACRQAGRADAAAALWATLAGWRPTAADEAALQLNAQVAFGVPKADCRATGRKLLALRTGDRWAHTRDTSWAVEALAGLLAYAPERPAVKRVTVAVAGKTELDVTDPGALAKLVYRLHLPADRLPADEGLTLRLTADCSEPITHTLSASGVQRLDKVEPVGGRLRVSRVLETPDGKPLTGPVAVGQVVAVRLTVEADQRQEYVIVEDRRPAGCEFAEDRLAGPAAAAAANTEFRDDRICTFFTALPAGRHELVYYLRAETAGSFHILPGCAYPMYDDKLRAETGAATLEVK